MNVGISAPGSGRDVRRNSLRFTSLAGAACATAAVAALWHEGQASIPPGFGIIAAVVIAASLFVLVRGLIRTGDLDRDNLGRRLAEALDVNAELLEKTKSLEVANHDLEVAGHDLEAAKNELTAAAGETARLLDAAPAQVLALDPGRRIGSHYSRDLLGIFGAEEIAGQDFLSVLERVLPAPQLATARDYLDLLFDPSRKERLLAKINPLEAVEIDRPGADPDGPDEGRRYVNFEFRRRVEAGTVDRVFVAVEDVTERTLREHRLREAEELRGRQYDLLVSILDVEPESLDDFLRTASEQMEGIDDALHAWDAAAATIGQTELLRRRLDVILRRVHDIKGHASLLRLHYFERKAHDFEQSIVDLKSRSDVSGSDFLALMLALEDFRADIDELEVLRAKLAGIRRNVEMRREVGDDLIGSIADLVNRLAAKSGLSVRVDGEAFDSRTLPPAQRLAVKDVLIQLARNSVVHGIENSDDREAEGKAPTATIEIAPATDAAPGTFAFTFRDDGRGLDADAIRKRAVESGLISAEDAAAADDETVAALIFEPGFSTASDVTTDAGRGLGMNLVKQRVVDDCGGEIGVYSEPGRFCEFWFQIPLELPPEPTVAESLAGDVTNGRAHALA